MTLWLSLLALLILVAHIPSTIASTLETRKSLDNLVQCNGLVPEEYSTVWPDVLPPEDRIFWSLNHLCRWHDSSPRSVGCVCFSPGDQTNCLYEYADEMLWASEDLREYCRARCRCPRKDRRKRPPIPALNIPNMPAIDPISQHLTNPPFGFGPATRFAPHNESTGLFVSPARYSRARQRHRLAYQAGIKSTSSTPLDIEAPRCAAGCIETNFRCTGERCQCRVDRIDGGLWNSMKCRASGLGNKDDEGSSCPCDSTYISHGCCDSEDGLI
jgi:hypothetical protein